METAGYAMLLSVLKNREFGAMPRVKLDFDPASRRFSPSGLQTGRRFSWERAEASGSVASRLAAHGRAVKQANRMAGQVQFQDYRAGTGDNPFEQEGS